MKSIIIIEDHSIVRVGIESIIEKSKDFYVLESHGKGLDGIEAIRSKKPDFAIVDLSLPDIDGEVIVNELFRENSPTKIIVLTRQKYIPQISHLLSLGVKGYLLKDHASKELITALEKTLEGKQYVSPSIENLLVQVGHVNLNDKVSDIKKSLTQRELQVIKMLCQGHDYKDIAEKLFISPSTARVHIRNLMKKLNAKEIKDIIKMKDSIL